MEQAVRERERERVDESVGQRRGRGDGGGGQWTASKAVELSGLPPSRS